MSLLRLLTTGKSLVTVTDEESRYRVTSQRLLPQFGAGRNPFSGSSGEETARSGARSSGGLKPAVVSPRATSAPALSGTGEAAPKRRSARVGAKLMESIGRLRCGMIARLGGWKAKLAGLVARRPLKEPKSAIPRFTKPPVQGELSLDRIKVLRNDLSDSDLEVVPAKPSTAPAAPIVPAAEKTAAVASGWGRMTARILSARKN